MGEVVNVYIILFQSLYIQLNILQSNFNGSNTFELQWLEHLWDNEN